MHQNDITPSVKPKKAIHKHPNKHRKVRSGLQSVFQSQNHQVCDASKRHHPFCWAKENNPQTAKGLIRRLTLLSGHWPLNGSFKVQHPTFVGISWDCFGNNKKSVWKSLQAHLHLAISRFLETVPSNDTNGTLNLIQRTAMGFTAGYTPQQTSSKRTHPT